MLKRPWHGHGHGAPAGMPGLCMTHAGRSATAAGRRLRGKLHDGNRTRRSPLQPPPGQGTHAWLHHARGGGLAVRRGAAWADHVVGRAPHRAVDLHLAVQPARCTVSPPRGHWHGALSRPAALFRRPCWQPRMPIPVGAARRRHGLFGHTCSSRSSCAPDGFGGASWGVLRR